MREKILALKDNSGERQQMLLTSVPVIVLILLVLFFEIVSEGRLLSGRNIDALLNSMFSIALGAAGVSFLMAHPVLSLTDMEYTCLSLYYSLVSVKIGDKDKMGYKESMRCLLKSFMCELYGVIGRYISVGSVDYSQGNNLFKGFLDILTSVYPKPRSVSFYAEKLNVTSKYLSSVCKATCGDTASVLIHKAVTKDIADLLSYSNKSIKEIMVELDFPSLSFFGKYVKKHFGVGPKEYRSRHLS